MSSIAVLPVPKDELERVATANLDLVEVARTLAGLAQQAKDTDPTMAATLQMQVQKLLHTSNTVSNAVRSASYLAR